MIPPILLLLLANAAAAVTAYGVHPDLAQYSNGLQIIILSRRLMWPAIALALIASIALFALVISGRRRIWWLVGLAPLMAMFVHRFASGSNGPAVINESPQFLAASDSSAPEAGDFVVGIVFDGHSYALPYRALFATPVVTLTDFDRRLMVIWSACANRAVAVMLTRDLRPRDLEVVSTPANSLLLLDRRLGQFIVGVTGRRVDGSGVVGFGPFVGTEKMPWSSWKLKHPETTVMSSAAAGSDAPTRPIMPQYKVHVPPSPEASVSIALLAPTTRPIAIANDAAAQGPLNMTIGDVRLLIVRDQEHAMIAFDRHAKEDLFLTFETARPNRRFPDATLIDTDTQSLWTPDGHAIDGPLKGHKLRVIPIDQNLYWGVMKFWYPNLELMRE